MEPTPSAPSSCAQRSIGTRSFHLRTRQWRVTPNAGRSVVNSADFLANDTWLEKHSRNGNVRGDNDDVSVWERVGLLLLGTFRGRLELCVVVKSNVAKFLFDTTTDLPLCGGHERVPALSEDLRQILCKLSASQIQTKDGVRQSVTFEMGIVCDTSSPKPITRPVVCPETYRTVWLAMYMASAFSASNLGLRHALSASQGVQKGVRGQNRMFFRRNLSSLYNVWCEIFYMSNQFVTIPKMPSICIPPWAGGTVTMKVGACDPAGRPLGLAPRSTHSQNGVNTHLSKNT